MTSEAYIVPNSESVVERKLKGVYGQVVIDVPFQVYEEYAQSARDSLDEIFNTKKELFAIMEDPLFQAAFAREITISAQKRLVDDMKFTTPNSGDLGLIFKADIAAAQKAYEDHEAEVKRQMIDEMKAQALRDAAEKASIEVSKENQAKAMALLSIAGLL
jgi:hypothetical protein